MKRIFLFLFLSSAILLVSCTTTHQVSDKKHAQTQAEHSLPTGYTLDAIKMALENYIEVVNNDQKKIQEPHQPDYGDSAYKDQMITAAIVYLKQFISDMQRGEGAKEWEHVQGYLVNFHEYDETANAWFIKENGDAVYVPFLFIKENGKITVDGITGYSLKNVMNKAPNDPDRVMLEQQIQDATHYEI